MARLPFTLDSTDTYIFLTPAEASTLAIYCRGYGETPPHGVFHCTWKRILQARTDAVSCKELGVIVDAIGPHLIAALRGAEVSAP